MTTKAENIQCPTCGAKQTWNPENSFRPFCSYRCKLIDLGEWADETRRIPDETINPDNLDDEQDS